MEGVWEGGLGGGEACVFVLFVEFVTEEVMMGIWGL